MVSIENHVERMVIDYYQYHHEPMRFQSLTRIINARCKREGITSLDVIDSMRDKKMLHIIIDKNGGRWLVPYPAWQALDQMGRIELSLPMFRKPIRRAQPTRSTPTAAASSVLSLPMRKVSEFDK